MRHYYQLGLQAIRIILKEGWRSFFRRLKRRLRPIETISIHGERVTHLYPNDLYYAHLSIYRFAEQFCEDRVVLDAGSGGGYGTAYLAKSGARLAWGIDIGADAVAFSNNTFKLPNLKYSIMDLQDISQLPSDYFDVVFTSNALEHVRNVNQFLYHVCRIIKPNGIMIISVPPILDEAAKSGNISNRFHLNIWSPRQWFFMTNLYFRDIHCYRHIFNRQDIHFDATNTPERTVITEKDFVFPPIPFNSFYDLSTITIIMTAQKPRPIDQIPTPNEPIVFIDDSFSR